MIKARIWIRFLNGPRIIPSEREFQLGVNGRYEISAGLKRNVHHRLYKSVGTGKLASRLACRFVHFKKCFQMELLRLFPRSLILYQRGSRFRTCPSKCCTHLGDLILVAPTDTSKFLILFLESFAKNECFSYIRKEVRYKKQGKFFLLSYFDISILPRCNDCNDLFDTDDVMELLFHCYWMSNIKYILMLEPAE